jgi:hypothetical protein
VVMSAIFAAIFSANPAATDSCTMKWLAAVQASRPDNYVISSISCLRRVNGH